MKPQYFSIKDKVLILVIIFTILAFSNLCVYAERTVVLPSTICVDLNLEDIKCISLNKGWAVGLDSIHETEALRQNLYAGWFGPSNYEECVEDNIKKVSSEFAARAILLSCRALFDDPWLSQDQKKYHNCILKNMKGVSTDVAARVIMQNCRKKFLGQ